MDNAYGPEPGFQVMAYWSDGTQSQGFEGYLLGGNCYDWTAGSWHHVAFSWDADWLGLYVDGNSVIEHARTNINPDMFSANGAYFLGYNTASGIANSFDGWVDDLAISDHAKYTPGNGGNTGGGTYTTPTEPIVPINERKAWLPVPFTGATVTKAEGSTLTWNMGKDAVTHKVYWDPCEAYVVNRTVTPITLTQAVDGNTTPTPSTPELGTTYYWVVDEVDAIPSTESGDLWQYTIAPYLTVDDMEDYDQSGEGSNEIWKTWIDGYPSPPGLDNGAVLLAIAGGHDGTDQAMEYEYNSDGSSSYGPVSQYYSEAVADTSNLDIGSDWTTAGVAWLQVHFKGQATNDANERMYVVIEDSTDANAMVQYGLPDSYSNPEWVEDMNNIKLDTWQFWGIDLRSFTGVNLADVQKVYIGFGTRGNVTTPGGTGTVIFDELRLLVPDVYNPSAIVPLSADLYDDGTVNFSDLAVLANEYLLIEDDGMWPDL